MEQTEANPRSSVVLCDLDGVVWLAHEEIPGSAGAIALLRDSGRRVVFVTNNSHATTSQVVAHLMKIGIPATGDVVTSARAAASVLSGHERVLVCGGPGIVEEVGLRGCSLDVCHTSKVRDRDYDAVVVGFHREFDFDVLDRASRAIRSGATFIATNEDPTYPTPDGLIPGGGSIVAAIATASGVDPLVTGKPHRTMANVVMTECKGHSAIDMVMVGDRVSTDGAFAQTIGCRFALVMSGVADSGDVVHADLAGKNLRDVARQILEEEHGTSR